MAEDYPKVEVKIDSGVYNQENLEVIRKVMEELRLHRQVRLCAMGWFRSRHTHPMSKDDHLLFNACKALADWEDQNPPPAQEAACTCDASVGHTDQACPLHGQVMSPLGHRTPGGL